MKTILLVLLTLCPLGLWSMPVDSLFANMPQEILPLLDRNARLNLLDFYNANMPARAENRLGGESVLELKSANYLRLIPVQGSSWEMLRMPVEMDSSQVIVCFHTLLLPPKETWVEFYSETWNPLPQTFPVLELDAFWTDCDSIPRLRRDELRLQLQPHHVVWQWEEKQPMDFVASVSLEGLGDADAADLRKCLRSRSFRWENGRLVAL